jgi:hypothetical protein
MPTVDIPSGWEVLSRTSNDLLGNRVPNGREWPWKWQIGTSWVKPFVLTFGWSDLILTLNSIYWDNESIEYRLIFTQLIAGGLLFVVIVNLAEGRPPIERLGQRLWRVLASSVVAGVITAAGFLLFIIPGIIALKRYFYAPYIAASQEAGPLDSMRRSSQLSMVNGWNALGYYWLVTLLSAAANYGVDLFVEWLKQSGSGHPSAAFLSYLNKLSGSLITGVILSTFGYYMYQLALKNEPG